MSPDFWNILNAIGAVASATVAAIGISLVVIQLRATRKIAEADLILRLEAEWVDHFSATYQEFLPGAKWAPDGPGPTGKDERVAIEEYLEFFATLSALIDKGLLPLALVDEMFAYRFFIAVNNPHTKDIVNANKDFWPSLLRLYSDWSSYRRKRDAVVVNHHDGLLG